MTHRLNARIDDDLAEKIERLRRGTRKTTTEIVRASIELYYERAMAVPDARRSLEGAGFIGCAEGDADLSANYKEHLGKALSRKTGR